ncbi:hypothetical protein [Pedobacter sp. SYSU D00535]|uniref:hypothetical protein n=1 Tax=Pedobacter sp. SYSU D00535 TaxID=2810308 RepID=UPI001A968B70|nr:hypothetical protein [Pedobacter sp. SYSU D00535]
MTNPNLILSAGPVAAAEFNQYLSTSNKVYLLILGNSPMHQSLMTEALKQAWNWRWVITAPDPTPLYPKLLSMPLSDGVAGITSPWPSGILALSITSGGSIAYIVTNTNPAEIDAAFMLAETN